jgi:hypothetical protein
MTAAMRCRLNALSAGCARRLAKPKPPWLTPPQSVSITRDTGVRNLERQFRRRVSVKAKSIQSGDGQAARDGTGEERSLPICGTFPAFILIWQGFMRPTICSKDSAILARAKSTQRAGTSRAS